MKIFIGIDPGLFGAIAVLESNGHPIAVRETPILKITSNKKKRNEYQLNEMRDILLQFRGMDILVGLENVHAMPGQGVRSMFSMGRGVGLWEGLLAGMSMSYDKITPQRWKKVMMDGMGKDKDASRLRAQQIFSDIDLNLKKHHGKAEALLIAEYLRRTNK